MHCSDLRCFFLLKEVTKHQFDSISYIITLKAITE